MKPSKKFIESGNAAAARYLERRGYEILHTDYECEHGSMQIIASCSGVIVFVGVSVRIDGEPEKAITAKQRQRIEQIFIEYLKENADSVKGDTAIRYDTIDLTIVAPERALIAHHINALAA